jgi:hypothetical protein
VVFKSIKKLNQFLSNFNKFLNKLLFIKNMVFYKISHIPPYDSIILKLISFFVFGFRTLTGATIAGSTESVETIVSVSGISATFLVLGFLAFFSTTGATTVSTGTGIG